MREFYVLTLGRNTKLKLTDFLYHFSPILKLLSIGLLAYALSLKGKQSYIFISTAIVVFIISIVLNFVRQKMLYEFRYTYDKINKKLIIEKAYFKMKASLIAVLPLPLVEINKKINNDNAFYFENNDMEYVISVGDGNNNYTIAVDTYMYALLTTNKL